MALLAKAYSVYPDQVLGPKWLTSEKYSLDAKIPPGTTPAKFLQMLQNLLIQRFGLIFERDEKDFNVYALLVASGGHRLTPSGEPHTGRVEENTERPRSISPETLKLDREGCPVRTPGSLGVVGSIGISNCTSFRQYSMSHLVSVLEMMLAFETGAYFGPQASREHIVDRTELRGKFDFNLKYNIVSRFRRIMPPSSNAQPSDPDVEESLFKALERQLGLKLEKTKARLRVIVVREIHKDPTDN